MEHVQNFVRNLIEPYALRTLAIHLLVNVYEYGFDQLATHSFDQLVYEYVRVRSIYVVFRVCQPFKVRNQ